MPGIRGDGKLHITFNEMGHGDNVLISLPNGKLVVIDSGSMRWDGNYWNPPQTADVLREHAMRVALADQRFLLNNKLIDLLILTHPDKDHCIEVSGLFTFTPLDNTFQPATKASKAFYSGAFSLYGDHGVPFILLNMGHADEIYALTLNQTYGHYKRVLAHNYHGTTLSNSTDFPASADNTAELLKKSRVAATNNFVKVLDGTQGVGPACAVYFLASNVEQYPNLNDTNSADNRGSIVTMIVFGDKKFLFMGDGTFNTENYLIQTYGNRIQNVELVHIPHHASFATSSSYPGHPPTPPNIAVDFVGQVNPRYAVITAAYDTGPQLGLPRYEIIDRYHQGARLLNKPIAATADEKRISCYQKQQIVKVLRRDKFGTATKTSRVERSVLVDYPATKHIWCTGTHGPIDFDYEDKGGGNVDGV